MTGWTQFSQVAEMTNRGVLGFEGKAMFRAQHKVACPAQRLENMFFLYGQR